MAVAPTLRPLYLQNDRKQGKHYLKFTEGQMAKIEGDIANVGITEQCC